MLSGDIDSGTAFLKIFPRFVDCGNYLVSCVCIFMITCDFISDYFRYGRNSNHCAQMLSHLTFLPTILHQKNQQAFERNCTRNYCVGWYVGLFFFLKSMTPANQLLNLLSVPESCPTACTNSSSDHTNETSQHHVNCQFNDHL